MKINSFDYMNEIARPRTPGSFDTDNVGSNGNEKKTLLIFIYRLNSITAGHR
jgi:hypothetical protein